MSNDLVLPNVLYVPKLNCNLMSVSKLMSDLNYISIFYSNFCEFQEVDLEKVIGTARHHSGLHLFQEKQPPSSSFNPSESSSNFVKFIPNSSFSSRSLSSESQVMLQHFCLGHPNFLYLEKQFPHLFSNKKSSHFQCEICQLSKHTRTSYPSMSYKSLNPFALIHNDIWGPSRVKNISGAHWTITFIDDHTKLTWTYLTKDKFETSSIFRSFHSMISTQIQNEIQVLRIDNG